MTAATATTHQRTVRSLTRWLAYLWTIGSARTAPHPTISTILTASPSPTVATNSIAKRATISLAQQALHNDRNLNVHYGETKDSLRTATFQTRRPTEWPGAP